MTKLQAIDKINIRKEQIHQQLKVARENEDAEAIKELILRLEEIQEVIRLFC